MSKKRTEFCNDGQIAESSEVSRTVSQQQGSTKRAKLVSLNYITLQDLPTELVECILLRVVVLEVKDMKLVKRFWEEKADLVINRLRTVCSRWSSICSTNFFRNEIHRMLDASGYEVVHMIRKKINDDVHKFLELKRREREPTQPTIRSEMLHEYPIQYPVIDVTALKDEIFILYKTDGDDHVINVFDRNNMTEVKDVIPLPGTCPTSMKACSISNNVYVLSRESEQLCISDSVLRVTRAGGQVFNVSPWITDLNLSLRSISVSAHGSLITLSSSTELPVAIATVRSYAANGFLQLQLVVWPKIHDFRPFDNAIQKSNGNIILVSDDYFNTNMELMEIDTCGRFVRLYQSSLRGGIKINAYYVDIHDRILITNGHCIYELLDSEFNRMEFNGLEPNEGQLASTCILHINSERSEIMRIYASTLNGVFPFSYVLAVFRLV